MDDDPSCDTCLWCTDSAFMQSKLKVFFARKKKHRWWIEQAKQDLCTCFDCVEEYHHIVGEALQTDSQLSNKRELIYEADVERLTCYVTQVLTQYPDRSKNDEEEEEETLREFHSAMEVHQSLKCPLQEMLKYPRLLLTLTLSELFVQSLSLLKANDQPLEVNEKYPGVYLLLVHPHDEVRRWALNAVNYLGPVDWDDYDELEDIVNWMLNVISFNQFLDPIEEPAWNDEMVQLPKHLFIHNSPKDFWLGVCMIISTMDANCIRSRLMNNHKHIVDAVNAAFEFAADNNYRSHIRKKMYCDSGKVTLEKANSTVFWPAMQCFQVLLEGLGSRYWQFTSSSAQSVLKSILSNPFFHFELKRWARKGREEDFSSSELESEVESEVEGEMSMSDSEWVSNSQLVYSWSVRPRSKKPGINTGCKGKSTDFDSHESLVALVTGKLHNAAFAWMVPFVHSLLDFGDIMADTIGSVILALNSILRLSLSGQVNFQYFHFISEAPVKADALSVAKLVNCILCNEVLLILSKTVEHLISNHAHILLVKFHSYWLPVTTESISLLLRSCSNAEASSPRIQMVGGVATVNDMPLPSSLCHIAKVTSRILTSSTVGKQMSSIVDILSLFSPQPSLQTHRPLQQHRLSLKAKGKHPTPASTYPHSGTVLPTTQEISEHLLTILKKLSSNQESFSPFLLISQEHSQTVAKMSILTTAEEASYPRTIDADRVGALANAAGPRASKSKSASLDHWLVKQDAKERTDTTCIAPGSEAHDVGLSDADTDVTPDLNSQDEGSLEALKMSEQDVPYHSDSSDSEIIPLKRKRKSPSKLILESEDSESDVNDLDDFASTSSTTPLKTKSHRKQAQPFTPRGRKQRLHPDMHISPSMKPSRIIGRKLLSAGKSKSHCSGTGGSSSKSILRSSTQQPQETTVKGIQGETSASPACSVKQLPSSSSFIQHPGYRHEVHKQITHSSASSFLCEKSDSDASTSSTAALSAHSSEFTEGTTTLHNELPSYDDMMLGCDGKEEITHKTAKSPGFKLSPQSRSTAQHRDSSRTKRYETSQFQSRKQKLTDAIIRMRRKKRLKNSEKAAPAAKIPVSNTNESVVIVISSVSDSSSIEPLTPRHFTLSSDKEQSPPATALNVSTEGEGMDFLQDISLELPRTSQILENLNCVTPETITSFPTEVGEEPKKHSIIAEESVSPGCERYDAILGSHTTLTHETSLSKDVVAVTDWCHQNDTHGTISSIEKVTRWLEIPNSQAGQTTDSHGLPIPVCTVEPDSQTDTNFVFCDLGDITGTQEDNESSIASSENYETALQVQASKLAIKESKPINRPLCAAVQDTALEVCPLPSTKLNEQHLGDANAQVKCMSSPVSITQEKSEKEGNNSTVTSQSEQVSFGARNFDLNIPANIGTVSGDTFIQLQASTLASDNYVQSDTTGMPHSDHDGKEVLASASVSEMSNLQCLQRVDSKSEIRLKNFTIEVERVPTKAIRMSSHKRESSLLSKKGDPESVSSASSMHVDLVPAKQSEVHKLAHDHSPVVSVSLPSEIHGIRDNKALLSIESSMSIDSSVLQYSQFRQSSVRSRKVCTESSSLQSDNARDVTPVTQYSRLSQSSVQSGKVCSSRSDKTSDAFGKAGSYGYMHKQKPDSHVVATNSGTSHRESAANRLFGSMEQVTFKKPHLPRQIQKTICVHTKPTKRCRMDDLHLEILSWEPALFLFPQEAEDGRYIRPHLQLSQEPSHVPEVFRSYDDYIDVFVPLLLLEFWENVFQDINDKSIQKPPPCEAKLELLSTAGHPHLQLLKCTSTIAQEQAQIYAHPCERDLVVINFQACLQLSNLVPMYRFAVVESVTRSAPHPHVSSGPNRGGLQQSTSQSGNSSCGVRNEVELTLTLKILKLDFGSFFSIKNCNVELTVATSVTTALRQWNGLINFHNSQLVRDVLHPRGGRYFCLDSSKESQRIGDLNIVHGHSYNRSQFEAIQSSVRAVCEPFALPRICLLQGPPGTGKTRTISGLIQSILKALNNQRQASSASNLPSYHLKAVLPTKPHILVCAPSNAGVDEVIRRLLCDGLVVDTPQWRKKYLCSHSRTEDGGKENAESQRTSSAAVPGISIVRVGQTRKIHPDVLGVSLDELAKKKLAKESHTMDAVPSRNEISKVESEIDSLQRQLTFSRMGSGRREDEMKMQDRLREKQEERTRLFRLHKQARSKHRDLKREVSVVRRKLVLNADVVFATLCGSGSNAIMECVQNNPLHFSCVIVDEAAQCSELDVLVPLRYLSSKLILVGDPLQLQATVKSQKALSLGLGQSLFERLYMYFMNKDEAENPVQMLQVQYRMLTKICQFPSDHFYHGKLKTCSALVNAESGSNLKPFLMFDVVHGQEYYAHPSGSIYNVEECKLLVEVCHVLLRSSVCPNAIGIITPYKAQERHIKQELQKRFNFDSPKIDVGTVDGFQGREKDIIILSCVRARSQTGSIGFLSNRQRMNVALTRSRRAVYTLGHFDTLQISEDWNALIEHGNKTNSIVTVDGMSYESAAKCVLKPDHSQQPPPFSRPKPHTKMSGRRCAEELNPSIATGNEMHAASQKKTHASIRFCSGDTQSRSSDKSSSTTLLSPLNALTSLSHQKESTTILQSQSESLDKSSNELISTSLPLSHQRESAHLQPDSGHSKESSDDNKSLKGGRTHGQVKCTISGRKQDLVSDDKSPVKVQKPRLAELHADKKQRSNAGRKGSKQDLPTLSAASILRSEISTTLDPANFAQHPATSSSRASSAQSHLKHSTHSMAEVPQTRSSMGDQAFSGIHSPLTHSTHSTHSVVDDPDTRGGRKRRASFNALFPRKHSSLASAEHQETSSSSDHRTAYGALSPQHSAHETDYSATFPTPPRNCPPAYDNEWRLHGGHRQRVAHASTETIQRSRIVATNNPLHRPSGGFHEGSSRSRDPEKPQTSRKRKSGTDLFGSILKKMKHK